MKPNFYKQIDPKWSSYSCYAGGGYPTIGGDGCGPTCCTNVISATTHPTWKPTKLFKWACDHGYMTADSGLYWSGIKAMLEYGGITGIEQTTDHGRIKEALKKGYWVIGLVGPSRWTRGGHFIVLYEYRKGNVYISDPASYAQNRHIAPFYVFEEADLQDWIIINPEKYIKKKEPKKKESKEAALYVKVKSTKVKKTPSRSAKAIATLKFNTKVVIKPIDDNWYQITRGKYKGCYVRAANFSKYAQNVRKYKVLGNMNVRAGYTTKAKIIGKVKKGIVLKSTKQRGRWAYFPKQEGLEKAGFICAEAKDGKRYLQKI